MPGAATRWMPGRRECKTRASGTRVDDATSRARMRRGPGELARQAPTASLCPAGLPPRSTGEGRTPPCGPFAGIPQCPGG